ncbi:MAG: deoxyribonuclease IV [Elusimicrobia bacterium]|nr:deoxyribonuclease IV [Elusimicrobiota bacterium]
MAAPRLGVHLTVGKGLEQALADARRLKIRAAQIFSKSPRMWAAGTLDREKLARFDAERRAAGIDTLAVHASYLLNLASPAPELLAKSIDGLVVELERAQAYGAEYLVLHTGSSSSELDRKAVIDRATKSIRFALKRAKAPGVTLLLENAAAERGEVGGGLAELGELIRRIDAPERVAACLDTCHAFQAGYDLREKKAVDAFAKDVEKAIGLGAVKLFHANDSKKELGGGLDRHQHIGQGFIGAGGFKALLRHAAFRDKPFVLETPKDDVAADRRNMDALRELAG